LQIFCVWFGRFRPEKISAVTDSILGEWWLDRTITVKLCTLCNKLLLVYSEWYSYHFPELVKLVTDNYTYARVAQYVGNRKQLTEERLDGLEKILLDSEKTRAIYDASRSSMGNAVLHVFF